MNVLVRRITIVNRLGLHARAAGKFVGVANRFGSRIRLCRGDKEVNGKSIMGVMMLAAAKGTELSLSADGDDAEAALDALEQLVADRFHEAE